MFCRNCGRELSEDIEFCPGCGAQVMKRENAEAVAVGLQNKLRIGNGRVIIVSIASYGLYLFYWFYLTWKQIKVATGRKDYHPVWHALALLVPIYSLFIVYRHMQTIKDLAAKGGVTTSLSPGGTLTLFIVSSVLVWTSARASLYGTELLGVMLVVDIISTVIMAGMLLWAQTSLNKCWNKVSKGQIRDAPLGVGEVVIVLIGLLLWATYLL